MAKIKTYRFGRWESWDGTLFYNIERKTVFGWREEKRWLITESFERKVRTDEEAKEEMMKSVDRLIKAGHTVI